MVILIYCFLAAQCMVDNWREENIPENFIIYFENEWINSSLSNWFTGCSDYGVTNNSLEATNNAFKNQITLRKKFCLKQLIEKLIKAVEYYSVAPEFQVIARQITMNENEYKNGFEYKNKKVSFYIFHVCVTTVFQLSILEYNNRTIFYAQSTTKPDRETFEAAVQERRQLDYDTMDWKKYCKIIQTCYVIRVADDFQKTLFCSCPVGAMKLACKHSVAIAVKISYTSYPQSVDSVLIEGNRKSGAPKKSKGGKPLSKK